MPFGCSVQFLPSLFPSSRNQKQQPTYILTSKNYAPNAIMVIYTCSFIFSFFFVIVVFICPRPIYTKSCLSFSLTRFSFCCCFFVCPFTRFIYFFLIRITNYTSLFLPFFSKKINTVCGYKITPRRNFVSRLFMPCSFRFSFPMLFFSSFKNTNITGHFFSIYLSIYVFLP